MSIDETFFITGFPGFIANRLVDRLAKLSGKFILLVQPSLMETAIEGIAEIAKRTGRASTDFRLVEGDITLPNLGLNELDQQAVRAEATTGFHLAALYDLAVARDLALKVNVEGTRNLNNFVRSLPRLRHHHHVSTCYVAGKREGRILETELRHDAGFRNFYEESKYLAELEVEVLKADLPVTIHRPAVVCGDSQTGETAKYDGVYYLIFYLLRWPGGLSLLNIGNSDVCLNLVPVDFVVDAMALLALDDTAIGKTVQLADPSPLTTNQLFNAIAKSINGGHSRITAPRSWVQFLLMLPPSPAITGLPHRAVPYFFIKQTYDTINSQKLLERHGVRCPPFQSYVDKIVEFAQAHPRL
ncbi:MAG TPA: SDR family oxidoreductase [Pyrinomonadaceae bacterium]|jgi:thioester reductase-like protein|nr:SDR family oxidoreductase [Pyrinomonadaceae bacterium]